MKRYLFASLFYFFMSNANADMLISYLKESNLPYDFSPSNYDNSPSNYDNSVNNYDNSPNNYSNSESNYDNSSSNYKNGVNGDSRLILKENGSNYRAGYYVMSDNGVLNFFSTKGKRLFYTPKNGIGVYNGKEGFFCGVLATVDGDYRLVLTEKGYRTLMINK